MTTSSSYVAIAKELSLLGVSGYLLRHFSADQVVRCFAKALQLEAKTNRDGSHQG